MPDLRKLPAEKPKEEVTKLGGKQPVSAKDFPLIIEPRCKVCQSPHRHAIDTMIVGAYTFAEIERQFEFTGIKRRSIALHKEKHLSYEEAGIRAIIDREAMLAQKNHNEGVERLITKQAYLELAVQKAYDQMVGNKVSIPAGEAVKVIETLQALETRYADVAIDEMRVQFNSFMQAVKSTVPPEMWEEIRTETHTNLRLVGRAPDLLPAGEKIQEAIVVETVDSN